MKSLDNQLIERIDSLLGGEIKSLPEYPYNPEVGKAIIELEKLAGTTLWSETNEKTATLYIEQYRQQQQSDYIADLQGKWEGRKIGLEDVMRAIDIKLEEDQENRPKVWVSLNGTTHCNIMYGYDDLTQWQLGKDLLSQAEENKKAILNILG